MIKKLFFVCGTLVFVYSLFAADIDKDAILKKVAAVYNQSQMSGEMETIEPMMGTSSTMHTKFWRKGNCFRVEDTIQTGQQPVSIQATMISDGKTLWQQDSTTPAVTSKVDLTKFPENMRTFFVQPVFQGFDPETLSQIEDEFLKLSDVTKNETGNVKYYVFTTTNLDVMRKNFPPNTVKKLVFWVDETTSQITRIEIYGDAQQPDMTTTYNNLSFNSIDDSLFQYTPPAGTQIEDATDKMLKDMFDGNNSVQPQSPVTEAQPGGSSGKSYTPAQINDLYDAVKSGNIEKVKTLLAGNPDLVTAKKDDGTTPLHWAANNGKKKIVEMLLEHGADVNAKDNAGYTPLHLALWNGSLNAGIKEMVEVLLAHGADVNAKADDGKTPLDWAMSNHHDIVEILRAHGGKSGKDIK